MPKYAIEDFVNSKDLNGLQGNATREVSNEVVVFSYFVYFYLIKKKKNRRRKAWLGSLP